MDAFHAMKGSPKRLLTVIRPDDRIFLVRYDDGSFGIVRDDVMLSIWEPEEETACIAAFARLTGDLCGTLTVLLNGRDVRRPRFMGLGAEPLN
jgi:hypothetical protein